MLPAQAREVAAGSQGGSDVLAQDPDVGPLGAGHAQVQPVRTAFQEFQTIWKRSFDEIAALTRSGVLLPVAALDETIDLFDT